MPTPTARCSAFSRREQVRARYATVGFNDVAALDDGNMWPTAFALMKLTAAEEARIAALVKKATGQGHPR